MLPLERLGARVWINNELELISFFSFSLSTPWLYSFPIAPRDTLWHENGEQIETSHSFCSLACTPSARHLANILPCFSFPFGSPAKFCNRAGQQLADDLKFARFLCQVCVRAGASEL